MQRFLLLTLVFLFFAIFQIIPNAFATGGAFKDTKHGGGIVDGIDFEGVNRALSNPDYPTGLYNVDNSEAGQYQSGECAHCHEPHASFGDIEPAPNSTNPGFSGGMTSGEAAGPDPYLVFGAFDSSGSQGAYSKLCWYCHDNFFGGGGPRTGYWNFYQGGGFASDPYQQSSHYKSLNFYWPGATNILPYGESFPRTKRSSSGGNVGSCLNCHTPHGISSSANYSGDVGAAPTTTNYTATNTTPTGLIPRQLIAWEEALCLRCHDRSNAADTQGGVLGPAATDIKRQIDNYLSTSSLGSGHPVRIYFDKHNLNQYNDNSKSPPLSPGWFTVANGNIHAECVDCHNPHVAQGRGTNMAFPFYGNVFQRSRNSAETAYNSWNTNRYDSPSDSTSSLVKIGPVNKGVWGIVISDLNTGIVTGIDTNLDPSFNDRLFQLCLKCHSYWAWGVPQGSTTPGTWYSPTTTRTTWDSGDGTAAYTTRQNRPMTDQSWEFALNRVSYHPVFGAGKNRPEIGVNGVSEGGAGDDTRNPCWCSGTTCPPTTASYPTQGRFGNGTCTDNGGSGVATGTRQDLASTSTAATLSQTFVPPWLHTSRITCVDCHEDSTSDASTTPRGPHGSARPFILRGLDTSISFPICTNSTCTSPSTVSYSAITDPNNFCLNCHRADVYGYNGVATTYKFSRLDHINLDNDNPGRIFVTSASKDMPNGIICMLCHGAATNQLGLIHGNDRTTTTNCGGACTNSARLLAINGGSTAADGEWRAYTKAYVDTAGACSKGGASAYCGHTGDGGWATITALYNY